MTLITGVFGTNVGGPPDADDPGGLFWTMALMGGAGAATFLVLKIARIL